MKLSGKVWKYGDNINTDVIYPGRHTYILIDEQEMGQFALEDLDPEFNAKAAPGDIIVAGRNWGCGSAREQAVKCLKSRGIKAIIAASFSRIYYRNCLNEGLLTIICPDLIDQVQKDDHLEIDMDNSRIRLGDAQYPFTPYPEYVRNLIESGGLIPLVKKRISEKNARRGE